MTHGWYRSTTPSTTSEISPFFLFSLLKKRKYYECSFTPLSLLPTRHVFLVKHRQTKYWPHFPGQRSTSLDSRVGGKVSGVVERRRNKGPTLKEPRESDRVQKTSNWTQGLLLASILRRAPLSYPLLRTHLEQGLQYLPQSSPRYLYSHVSQVTTLFPFYEKVRQPHFSVFTRRSHPVHPEIRLRLPLQTSQFREPSKSRRIRTPTTSITGFFGCSFSI